jgi:hypothetical protein
MTSNMLLLLLIIFRGPRIARFLNAGPLLRFNIKFPQIIQPIATIVTTKEIYAATGIGNDHSIVFTTSRPLLIAQDFDFFPRVGAKVEGIEIIQSTRATTVTLYQIV